jgi:hypothetical protein
MEEGRVTLKSADSKTKTFRLDNENPVIPNHILVDVPWSSCKVQSSPATIASVKKGDERDAPAVREEGPFQPRTMVVLTLANPREKFWGVLLSLSPEGVSLCGIELASFEDLVSMVKEGEQVSPGVVFFPTHRIERMELDRPDGNISSLSQRFAAKTGLDPVALFARRHAAEDRQ